MPQKKSSSLSRIRQSIPEWARPGLVMLSREDKKPIEKAFTTCAAQRYAEFAIWDEDARLTVLADHIDKGGNLGWVPHPNVIVLDADNSLAVAWIKNRAGAVPVMTRKKDRRHFYFRCDYTEFPAYKRGVAIDLERGIAKIDCITPGHTDPDVPAGGQCVVPPSVHSDGISYKWESKLPDSFDQIPVLPTEIKDELIGFFDGKKTKVRDRDSRHLRSLKYQRRLAIEAEEDTLDTRVAIRASAAEFVKELYSGDPKRTKDELDDLDRQLEGAFNLEGAFQGFQRDGTAESVACEIAEVCGNVAFSEEDKKWRIFDGEVWKASSKYAVSKIIGDHYSEYFADAAIEEDDDHAEFLHKVGMRLKGVRFVDEVRVRMQRNLRCSLTEFDKSKTLITFPADEERGLEAVTLDTATGETWEPRPEDAITLLAGVPYARGYRHPVVDEYWRTSFPNEETRASTQAMLGATMMGVILEELIVCMHGRGASGKGALANATMLVLGDYAAESDPSTWSGDGGIDGSRNAPDLARLRGKRFVFVDEIAANKKLGARAKALSQDGFITAAAKYAEPIQFPITWSVWIAGNARPKIDVTDSGLMRRIREIPMNSGSDSPDKPDWRIKDTLKRDRDAQIAWCSVMLDGLDAARDAEFRPSVSQEIADATDEWVVSSDTIGDWWMDRVELTNDKNDEVKASDLMKDYEEWMDDNYGFRSRGDVPRANKMQFAAGLQARGLVKEKRGGVVRYSPVRLAEEQDTQLENRSLPPTPKRLN